MNAQTALSQTLRSESGFRWAICVVLALFGQACGGGAGPPVPSLAESSIDPAMLFAAPTAGELAAIRASWADARPSPADVVVELRETTDAGTLTVVSHTVDGATHYGAIVTPELSEGPLPVLLFLSGFGPPFEFPLDGLLAGSRAEDAIVVIPSFRGHRMTYGEREWTSGGVLFDQCDGGTRDALALLDVATSLVPEADPDYVVTLGGSRGGNVSLLLGVREPSVRAGVSIAGPTNYLVPEYAEHPNMRVLYDEWFLEPIYTAESPGPAELLIARDRMLRCSPLYFAADLPPMQIHHGTGDRAVPVATAEALEAAWLASENSNEFEVWYYPEGEHTLPAFAQEVQGRLDAWTGRWLGREAEGEGAETAP